MSGVVGNKRRVQRVNGKERSDCVLRAVGMMTATV